MDVPERDNNWNAYWREHRLFLFDQKDTKKPIYVIDTPPPFTNGELHMGQIFWVCYIDAIARYKRMQGFNVLYPQGWDAHGFPTEIAVEKKYGRDMDRNAFYQKCVELSEDNIKKMKEQMLLLGSTFDERYEYKTTSSEYTKKVQLSLLQMHKKGMLYRDSHPVMWCTKDVSGIGNPETEEREEETVLNYIKFEVEGAKASTMTIATARPELLHACVAIAVNPKDDRFEKLVGKKIKIPIFGSLVEIIADDYVDLTFGTGAEMVCTFGDKADVDIYLRHKPKFIEAIDEKGILKNAGQFDGLTLDKARGAVISELQKQNLLIKQEKIKHVVKVHDRCETRIEYIIAKQWFIKIKEHADKIKKVADEITWHPDFTKQRLYDWVNFVEWDWNITRNRVFGTPIPFWSCQKCDFILAPEPEELPIDTAKTKPKNDKCPKCGGKIAGTRETLDSWVDTSITPLIIAGWPDNRALLDIAFPNAVRIQGTDIIRTWAFYTIFRSYMVGNNKPFEHMIAHGMILGTDGREMHKRFGNGVYLEDLMSKYSIDTVRLWVALSGGIGKDKAFSYTEMDFAKGFITKLENSAKFVNGALEKGKVPKEEPHRHFNIFDLWILNRLNQTIKEITEAYDDYNLYAVTNKVINFYWHEFADYYIENVKHRVYSTDRKTANSKIAALFTLKHVLNSTLAMLAPVMPFTCEEINSLFDKKSIFEQRFPSFTGKPTPSDYIINGLVFKSGVIDIDYENAGAFINGIISEVRKAKAKSRIALNKEIASININVPEEYYSATMVAKEEIKNICKAGTVAVERGQYSVEIKL